MRCLKRFVPMLAVAALTTSPALAAPAPGDDIATCTRHLEAIRLALLAYQKEKKELPAHLSDLVPRYLADKETLHCPADASPGEPGFEGVAGDPKLPISYQYAMSVDKGAFGYLLGPGLSSENATWRSLTVAQRAFFGDRVPVVRCWHHLQPADGQNSAGKKAVVLNLTLKGQVYESGANWEIDPETLPAVLACMERDEVMGPQAFRQRWSPELIAAYFDRLQPLPAFQIRLLNLAVMLDVIAGRTGDDPSMRQAADSVRRVAGDYQMGNGH